jgi:inosine/xanthosine triphosphate pyrophosphatase family protein
MRPIGEKLVIATHNRGKLREIAALVEPLGIACVGAEELGLPEPDEIGILSRQRRPQGPGSRRSSGFAALADDSGLCVDAACRPGIFSARWKMRRKPRLAEGRWKGLARSGDRADATGRPLRLLAGDRLAQ